MDIIDILPFQGANWAVTYLTQGVAIGLKYIGLSARRLCLYRNATKWQHNLARWQRPGKI
jgi:hypothetical protein